MSWLRPLFFIVFFFFSVSSLWAQEWKEEKSTHFIVYYLEDSSFANKVKKKCEVYYKNIAREIGFSRYSNFWTWDNRCKIYIFPTKESYLRSTNQPEWSGGAADIQNRAIYSYKQSKNFLTSLLPHELTHLIFRDFVGFTGTIPLWLDEGLAQFEEKEKILDLREKVKQIVEQKKQIPLAQLMVLDIRGSKETRFVALFYAQASMLVGYLIEEHGSDKFTHFCRQLRDGKTIEEALTFAYPGKFRTIEALEASWIDYVQNTF